jgi:crotonobetainyl-CoA:carnitine CoA-transferase CaiB-like acyl-CoA transferase
MSGPLSGYRVADFTWVWAGPTCTMQLAHMGAEVIRMESMRRPCLLRSLPPWPDGQPGLNRSGYFNQYNQGKRSILLDLSRPEAVEIAKKLVAVSDVAAENFAGGVLARLGLGYEALKTIKSGIIMISMSGYGQTGPEAGYVSYGPAQVPLSGLSSLTSYEGWPPMHVGMSYGDPTAGLHAAFAVLAALFHREKSGEGQYIDMSQWESSLSVVAEGIMDQTLNGTQPPRMGNRIQYMAPHGIYRCAGEDRWVSIAVLTDDEWHAFCRAIGQPALADDPRFRTVEDRKANEDALDAIVEAWTSELDRFEVRDRLQAAGVAAFPPMSNKDLAEDPHLNERKFFVEKEHPEVGVRKHAGMPWKMSETPCEVWRAAPTIGQDNDYVYGEVLGFSSAQIADLVEREIIR